MAPDMARARCGEVGATQGRWRHVGATQGRWRHVGATKGRWKQVVKPHLLLLLILLNSAAAGQVVESLQDGFGYYYKIAGYALNNTADYQVVRVNSSCECHRWCQVLPACSSVSVVTTAGGGSGGIECRVSKRPAVLTNVADRPKLYRNPTAMHFLFTELPNWNEVEDDGFRYQLSAGPYSWSPNPGWCQPAGIYGRLVTIITLAQMRIIMGKTTKNVPYIVNLSRSPNGQPTWDVGGAAIPYNQTELEPARVVDHTSPASYTVFSLVHDGTQYTFTGANVAYNIFICQENFLNLVL